MSVYQSSMLGDEDEDEIDTGFRQVLDIMVTPVATMCISNSAQKKIVKPEWDDKVFVLNCLCYLQVCFFFSPFFRLASSTTEKTLYLRVSWLHLISLRRNKQTYRL